jgi:hypothetical protein
MFMLRLSLFLGFAALVCAQDASDLFHKPPAAVDKALRERVSEFFQDHVTGEYRKAEAIVAEDTKDYFYDHDKPKYLGFEIQKIKYNEDFTKAEVTVICDQYMNLPIPGFQGKRMKLPTPSYWKLENGQWYWYIDKEKLYDSPFGHMHPGPEAKDGAPGQIQVPETAQQFFAKLTTDKDKVQLKPGAVEHVIVDNGTTNFITLEVINHAHGIRASLEQSALKPGDKTTLSITALDEAQSGMLNLRILPFGPDLPIQITVK